MIKPILIPMENGSIGQLPSNKDLYKVIPETKNMLSNKGTDHLSYDIILIDTEAEIVEVGLCLHLGFNRIEIWTGNQELDIQLRRKIISATNKLTIRDYKFKDGCPAKGFIGFNKSLPLLSHNSIQLLMDYHNEYKCMPDSVDIEYIIDEDDKRNWYEDVPSGKYWEDIPTSPSKNNLYTNAEHKICKLNNQGGVDITIPEVETFNKFGSNEGHITLEDVSTILNNHKTEDRLGKILNNIINDILCKKIGNSLRKNPNSNDISIFVTDWIGKNL